MNLGRPALLQTPSKKFKGDSRYTGSDNEDDFNDFTMNKGFIQYDNMTIIVNFYFTLL